MGLPRSRLPSLGGQVARNDIIKSQTITNDKAQMPNKAQNPNDKKK